MSFQSLLIDICTIYERKESIDADTGEQTFTNTKVAENVPCALQHSSGGLDRTSRLIRSDNTDRLFLFPQAFTIKKQDHIIEVRNNTYRVREIIDLGGRKRFLRLDLERVDLND
jgi:hypothetical protein